MMEMAAHEYWEQNDYEGYTEIGQTWMSQQRGAWCDQSQGPIMPNFEGNFPPRQDDKLFALRGTVLELMEKLKEDTMKMHKLQEWINILHQKVVQPSSQKEHKILIQEKEVPPPSQEEKKSPLEEAMLRFIEEERARREKQDKMQEELTKKLVWQETILRIMRIQMESLVNLVVDKCNHHHRIEHVNTITPRSKEKDGEVEPKGQILQSKQVEKEEFIKESGETSKQGEERGKRKKGEVKGKELMQKEKVIDETPNSKDHTPPPIPPMPKKECNEVTTNPSLAKTHSLTPNAYYNNELLYHLEDFWDSDDEKDFDIVELKNDDMTLKVDKVEIKEEIIKNKKKKRKAKREKARMKAKMIKEKLKSLEAKIINLVHGDSLESGNSLNHDLNDHSIYYEKFNPPSKGKDLSCRREESLENSRPKVEVMTLITKEMKKSETYVPPHLKPHEAKELQGVRLELDQEKKVKRGKKRRKRQKGMSLKDSPT